jgi:single-strand DNA-binding protein
MSDINSITLSGKLGQDPNQNKSVVSFSLATNHSYKDKDGNWQKDTTWHSCVCFGQNGEYVMANVKKGTALTLKGHMHEDKWTGADGKEHKAMQVVVEQVSLANAIQKPAVDTDQKKVQDQQQQADVPKQERKHSIRQSI